MSLINDALKRTKEVQQPPSSSVGPGIQLRLLQTAPGAGRGRFLARLGLRGGAVLVAVLAVWFRGHIYRPALRTVFARVYASQPARGGAQAPRAAAPEARLGAKADSPFLGPESPEQAAHAKARDHERGVHQPGQHLPAQFCRPVPGQGPAGHRAHAAQGHPVAGNCFRPGAAFGDDQRQDDFRWGNVR